MESPAPLPPRAEQPPIAPTAAAAAAAAATTADATAAAAPAWAARKLRDLVDAPSPAESPGLLAAVRAVSAVFPTGDGNNSAAARRALRAALDEAGVQSSADVLAAFVPAQAALAAVQLHVDTMRADVLALSGRLRDARSGAGEVVSETGDLRRRLEGSALKEVVARAFVARFTMRDDERQALAGSVVDGAFLDALQRLERIHDESRALLRSRNQRAGLEALEYAATTREEAYEKVLRFVQARCGELDVDAEEQECEAALLRNAIRALRARPMLLRLCSEEVGSARRASLVGRFVTALTTGGPGGMPRPIEMHAHDAMRYTNDMLAWMHQALASEKELMYRLFATSEGKSGRSAGGGGAVSVAARDGDERVREHNDELAVRVLNTVFDALCRPFRIRFEQALEQTLPVVVLYRLASLLEFYAGLMGALLGREAALPEMLMECNSVAMYAFFSAWKSKMAAFRTSGAGPSDDLTPPLAVYQSMTRLDEIMATLDASLAPKDAREGQIGAILEVILNPLLSLCDMMSAKAQTPMEARIFLSNCIDAMRMPLAAYSFAAVRVEQLVVVADEHIDEYTRLASIAVLRRCGLAERVRIMAEAAAARASPADADPDADRPEQRRARRPLSEQGGMDVESLSISVKNFYAMLFGGSAIAGLDALAPPAVDKITNVRARSRAKQAVAKVLGDAHADITAAVLDPYNQYGPDAASVVGLRDAAKVAVVLSGR
jgi:conserved oligomeric Golgi complex subunit 6